MKKDYLFVIVWETESNGQCVKTSFHDIVNTSTSDLASAFKKFITDTHSELDSDTGNEIIFTDVIG